ncbi:MAG: hypothetical protein MR006_01795 [Arcanobacterium sp.]|nr:hypothetical protein [Arcanobacterium sp.]
MDTKKLLGKNLLPHTRRHSFRSLEKLWWSAHQRAAREWKTMSAAHIAKSAVPLDTPEIELPMSIKPAIALEGERSPL